MHFHRSLIIILNQKIYKLGCWNKGWYCDIVNVTKINSLEVRFQIYPHNKTNSISFQYIVSGHFENLHLVLKPSFINLQGNTSYNENKCQYSGYVYGIIQSEVSLNICQGVLVSWGKYLNINSNKIFSPPRMGTLSLQKPGFILLMLMVTTL